MDFDLLKTHEEEINVFPVAYAFGKEQLVEALKKIGAKDISECCTVLGYGDI